MENNFETKDSIYEQDCNFVRYHDGRMWNRFKTIAAIEGAMLFGLYQLQGFGPTEENNREICIRTYGKCHNINGSLRYASTPKPVAPTFCLFP